MEAFLSQHIFEQNVNDKTYQVQIGWDNPLQHFFCTITIWVEDDDFEEGGYFNGVMPIWSDLYSLDRNFSLDEIAAECTKLGIVLPDGLLENVEEDKIRRAANEFTYYDPRDADKDTPKIRRLNDEFRRRMLGNVLLTESIVEMPVHDRDEIISKVQLFNDFNEANDPQGEHSHAFLNHGPHRIFFKIDYYDNELRNGSEDPADPSQTSRVLTIGLAHEM